MLRLISIYAILFTVLFCISPTVGFASWGTNPLTALCVGLSMRRHSTQARLHGKPCCLISKNDAQSRLVSLIERPETSTPFAKDRRYLLIYGMLSEWATCPVVANLG